MEADQAETMKYRKKVPNEGLNLKCLILLATIYYIYAVLNTKCHHSIISEVK